MRKTEVVFIMVIILVAVFSGCEASADDITGLWYEKTGYAGTLEFKDGGVVLLVMADQTYSGTYTFNNNKGEGKINIVDPITSTSNFVLSNGEINVDNGTAIYTRKKVNSKDIGNIIQGLKNSGK